MIRTEVVKDNVGRVSMYADMKIPFGFFKHLNRSHSQAMELYHQDWKSLIHNMNLQVPLLDPKG